MTNLEVKFYESVPYELSKLNENLEILVTILTEKSRMNNN